MVGDFEEFQELGRLAAERQRDRDRRDLNHETAGLETGRMARFMPGERSIQAERKRKREAHRQFLNELDRLMSDPVYAAAYRVYDDFLQKRVIATETAIERALVIQAHAQQHLSDLDDQANRLPDGRKVFRNANGKIVDGDGREIDATDAAAIVWRSHAPTYEEYRAAKDRLAEINTALDGLYGYQTDLAESRNRLENDDSPMTIEDMEAEQSRLEDQTPDLVIETFVGEPQADADSFTPASGLKPSL